MRRKLLSFILAFCLMIPCALVFTACDKDEPPKKVDPPTVVYVTEETSLASAVQQVAVGGKVILNVDVTLETQVNINKKMTLDLNGKTINNTVDIWQEYQTDAQGNYVLDGNDEKIKLPVTEQTWSLISVMDNGELVVIGNGRMETKLNDCYAFDVRGGGKLTIENGQFMGNISAVYVHAGEAIINDGVYGIQQLSNYNDSRYLLNCFDENYNNDTANITVNGGVFLNFNPQNDLSEGENTNFLGEGVSSTPQEMQDSTVYVVASNIVE